MSGNCLPDRSPDASIGEITWFRYVRFDRIPAYEAIGWRVVSQALHLPHGHYAVLMIYDREGDPIEPEAQN